MPWTAASAIAGGVGVVSGLLGSSSAKKAAKKAARLERAMTDEQVKRLRADQAADRSRVEMLQAASGFSDKSVTSRAYKAEFERLQQEEIKWLKLVGASKYQQQKSRADAYMAEGIGRAFNDAASIFSMLAT